jgi:proteic killer suppression protein
MIKTFRHKGLQAFFETGSKAGIQPHHAARLRRQLARFDLAKTASDMNVPGWGGMPWPAILQAGMRSQ